MLNTTYQGRAARIRRRAIGALIGVLAVGAVGGLAGCGGASTKAATPGLPAPPATATFNTYVGTQGAQANQPSVTQFGAQGGLLNASLDDTSNNFAWSNWTFGGAAFGGTVSASGAYLDFTTTNNPIVQGVPVLNANPAYGLEIPGRALLLRPGDYTAPPTLLVPVSTAAVPACQVIGSYETFQFVTLPDPFNSIVETPIFSANASGPAYGVVSAKSNGSSFSFINYNRFYLDGASTKPLGLQPGLCAKTGAGTGVAIPPDVKNNIPGTTIEVGPSGIFLIDQTQTQPAGVGLPANGPSASIGVVQPSSALSVSSIIAATYAGFKFEPILEPGGNLPSNGDGCPITELVGFGATAGTGTSLVGGTYGSYPAYACTTYPIPGFTEDPTATPLSDTTITLGAQSNNGLFQNASVTEPDPNGVCLANGTGTVGVDANGNPTCTFPAVVVAGNPEGKFVLFLVANDLVNSSPLGIYLFQQ